MLAKSYGTNGKALLCHPNQETAVMVNLIQFQKDGAPPDFNSTTSIQQANVIRIHCGNSDMKMLTMGHPGSFVG